MISVNKVPETALEWHQAGKGAALATVIETWGSAPRRVGSQLVVSGNGDIEGSVSGGCVEGAVIIDAMEALEQGEYRILEFGVSDDDAFQVGLACGGKIRILVEPVGTVISEQLLVELVMARSQRDGVVYWVDLQSGERRLVFDGYDERLRSNRSGFETKDQFVVVHAPPLRLIIIGAVHIAQALVPMARIAGYDPIIVDPREVFSSTHRFVDETILQDWPDEALQKLGLDIRTALVLLTHDAKLDDPAIRLAVQSKVFYIGALGSKRTHMKRVERLSAAGLTASEIDRIRAPIGLDIGAAGPAEIAVSILGEMTATLRGRLD
ncbi:MAG: XdhC family protein [Aestuariivita sp.]|nr:XdhC family protein [Aestuariivita sp.]